jgi:hypothetical protein
MCGYAAAYAHSFCMLSCVERLVDMWIDLHGETVKYINTLFGKNAEFLKVKSDGTYS